jgi:hypothetical protein
VSRLMKTDDDTTMNQSMIATEMSGGTIVRVVWGAGAPFLQVNGLPEVPHTTKALLSRF